MADYYTVPLTHDGRLAYDRRDDWLVALVNEQQAEIERLTRLVTDTEQVRDQRWQMAKDYRSRMLLAEAENERFKAAAEKGKPCTGRSDQTNSRPDQTGHAQQELPKPFEATMGKTAYSV